MLFANGQFHCRIKKKLTLNRRAYVNKSKNGNGKICKLCVLVNSKCNKCNILEMFYPSNRKCSKVTIHHSFTIVPNLTHIFSRLGPVNAITNFNQYQWHDGTNGKSITEFTKPICCSSIKESKNYSWSSE